MEHRGSDRVFSDLSVVLFKNNVPVISCKASNLSVYGLFVKTGPVKFRRNSILEVEFVTPTNSKSLKKSRRIPVYVVHHTKQGLGLAFMHEGPQIVGFVKKLINEASNAMSPRRLSGNNNLIMGK